MKNIQQQYKKLHSPIIKSSKSRLDLIQEQIVTQVNNLVDLVYSIPKTSEFVHAFQQVITFANPDSLSKNIIASKEKSPLQNINNNSQRKKQRTEDDAEEELPLYWKNFRKTMDIPDLEFQRSYSVLFESMIHWSIELQRMIPPIQEFELGTFPLYKLGAYIHSMYTASANIAHCNDVVLIKLIAECNNWLNLLQQPKKNISSEDNSDVKDFVSYRKYKEKTASKFISKTLEASSSSASSSSSSTGKFSEEFMEYVDTLGKPRMIPTIQIALGHLRLQEKLAAFKPKIMDEFSTSVFVENDGILSNTDFGDVYNPKTHASFCKPSSIMWQLWKKLTLDILQDACDIETHDGKILNPEHLFWPVWMYTWTVYELVSEFPIFDEQEEEAFVWFCIGKWITRIIENIIANEMPRADVAAKINVDRYFYPFSYSIHCLAHTNDFVENVTSKMYLHSTQRAVEFCSHNLFTIAQRNKCEHLVTKKYEKDKESAVTYLRRNLAILKYDGGFDRVEKWILHCVFYGNLSNRFISLSPAIFSF
jgi:hypothetical protein